LEQHIRVLVGQHLADQLAHAPSPTSVIVVLLSLPEAPTILTPAVTDLPVTSGPRVTPQDVTLLSTSRMMAVSPLAEHPPDPTRSTLTSSTTRRSAGARTSTAAVGVASDEGALGHGWVREDEVRATLNAIKGVLALAMRPRGNWPAAACCAYACCCSPWSPATFAWRRRCRASEPPSGSRHRRWNNPGTGGQLLDPGRT
jgi:hypothetical protein